MNEWNNAPTEEMSAEQKLTERQDEAVQTQEAAEREEQAEAAQMTGEAERNTAELPESGEDSAEACPEDVEEASEKGAAPETEEVADGDAEPREEATEEWDASEEDMADGFEDTEDTDQAETEEVSAEEEDMAAEDTGAAAEGNTVAARPETKPDGSGEEAVDSASLASIEPLLDDRIVRAVREMGFEKLTPIQVQAIPYLLDGEDIIGQAQTGTGKTAAFAIPALQKIDPDLRKLQTIILCPTRELAMQAAEEIRNIAKFMHGIKVLPVYGGQDISKQIRGLKDVQIVVGTPGRVMDHMRRRTMKLDYVNMVVLDEADEMLDMGFREDMELILGEVPNAHQTALFSATMPQPILEIANRFQKDARLVRVAAKELTIPLVSQRYYRVKSHDKDAACIRLLEYYQPKLCLIFCNTKIKVDEVSELLKTAEFRAEGLHGDMSQHQRDVAMNHFRNGSTNILIATDVAARGIDVDNVEVVINYDVPQDNEYYVHRIGRTGRAGKTGRSFTFVSGRELFRLRQIERFCHTTIEERELPNASKVMKAKAEKYLNRSWTQLSADEISQLKEGKALPAKQIADKNGKTYTVVLQINADRRGIEFVPGAVRKQEQSQTQNGTTSQQQSSWLTKDGKIKPLTKWAKIPLTEQQQRDYAEGRVAELTNRVDDKGQPCTVYLWFNPEKQRPNTSLKDPRVKIAEESKVQTAVNNDGCTNEATSKVAEPLQKYQTSPKNEEQARQQRKPKGPKM